MEPCDQLQAMALTYTEICQGETPWVALGNFMNDWFENAKDRREQLVIEPIALPPQPTTELLRWAAFCAASVEWLCERYSVPCPSWVSAPTYTLAEPWFDDPNADRPYVREWLLQDTPEPFRRRNVYCGDRLFENKYEFAEAVRQLRREQQDLSTGKSGSSSRDKADRRAGPHQGPYVNNGELSRARNNEGTWRARRSDAGKPRSK